MKNIKRYKYALLCFALIIVAALSVISFRFFIDSVKYDVSRDREFVSPNGNSYVTLRYDYAGRPYLFYGNQQVFRYNGSGFNENVFWEIKWLSENTVSLYLNSPNEKYNEEYYVNLMP